MNAHSVTAAQDPAHIGGPPRDASRAFARPPNSVVLVGPLPPPSGGMANQTRQLAELLAAEGCRVQTVQSNRPYRPRWVEPLRGVRALFRIVPFVAQLWRSMRDAELVHVMANSGWAWHLFAAPPIWVAAVRGVPVVVNYRGGNAEAFLRHQVALVRPTLARVALLIVPSGFLCAVFAKHGIGAAIVPNVVNLEAFRPAASRPVVPHILVTRNLERIYDIETAIRAFAQVQSNHRDARLTIAGSGPERLDLERVARELGVAGAVRFTGRLDSTALPDLYRQASVVLNPSRVDNMPNSLLEALASGVPVVSTNVGGITYLVEDGRTALLVPPGDPTAMADAVLRLHADLALAEHLRAAGLESVAHYSWPKVRATLFEAYERARGRAAHQANAA